MPLIKFSGIFSIKDEKDFIYLVIDVGSGTRTNSSRFNSME
jgi:hypothetical protein